MSSTTPRYNILMRDFYAFCTPDHPIWRPPLDHTVVRGRRGRLKMKTRFVFAAISSLSLVLFLTLQPVPSQAVTVTVIGIAGTNGAPGVDGGPGGNATATTPPNIDPSNTANATGGAGGSGGTGIAFPAVNPGTEGAGGNASATATTSTPDAAGNGYATATSIGGAGGAAVLGPPFNQRFLSSAGGNGGSATSNNGRHQRLCPVQRDWRQRSHRRYNWSYLADIFPCRQRG